jgi:hypothetical protein
MFPLLLVAAYHYFDRTLAVEADRAPGQDRAANPALLEFLKKSGLDAIPHASQSPVDIVMRKSRWQRIAQHFVRGGQGSKAGSHGRRRGQTRVAIDDLCGQLPSLLQRLAEHL